MDTSLRNLYEYLLNLDFFNDIMVSDQLYNAEVEQEEINAENKEQLVEVPLDFVNTNDYIKVWEPLFFIECKANILKTIQSEEGQETTIKIVDYAVQNDVVVLDLILENQIQVHAHDLILFSTQEVKIGQQQRVPHGLAIVENYNTKLKILINLISQNERVQELSKAIMSNRENKLPLFIKRLSGLSTIEREFKALHHINQFHIKDYILHPKQYADIKTSDYFSIPAKVDQQLKLKFNESQLDAIKETLKSIGITLIQGPPGTGKTKTVIGTLSVLLQSFQDLKQPNNDSKMQLERTVQEVEKNQKLRSPWLNDDYDDWRNHIFDEELNEAVQYLGFKTYVKANTTDRVFVLHREELVERAPEKILVCGPSNASVDEIVKKVLDEGLIDRNGNIYHPVIVRIGENYDSSVEHVSLDRLVEQRMFEQKQTEDQDGLVKIQVFKQFLNINQILKQAKIIFGTLSSAGSQLLVNGKFQFDTVIIDEAAQAVEISTLIPLQYGCKRLILIGDHNQLPATVFSKTTEKYKYSLSLFERLQMNQIKVHLLKVQYRMHSSISKFISNTFYKGAILDAPNLHNLIGNPDMYKYYGFSQFVVYHIKGYEEFINNSYRNDSEVKLVTEIFVDLLKKFPKFDLSTFGIVSPYTAQISAISRSLKRTLKIPELPIEVKTVDGFQGREKDVIIFSTVRSSFSAPGVLNSKQSIGFLKDARRMNVSLSRCRLCLVVVCDAYKLKRNKLWRSLIEYAMSMGNCYKVDTKMEISQWFQEFNNNPLRFQLTEFQQKKTFQQMQTEQQQK